ncbi:hypothetical protein Atc_1216 [Acidithiobacillus caldus SM-1]|uniref:Helicase C-terminal domain-containing protein n=1 Tax=Acidithiobacillus caldus (strain SM-1) TaxID=990288 RepID=F9ZMV6_ACICS|nr:helicase-related protein [Acidithiobacillus caldus]AEK57865.1 hypothetical protein Atc_1216 [Acidithiobacillus caldus SM-1]
MLDTSQRSVLGWIYEISVKSGFWETLCAKNALFAGKMDEAWRLSWKKHLQIQEESGSRLFSDGAREVLDQYLRFLWPLGHLHGQQLAIDLESTTSIRWDIFNLVRLFCPFPNFPSTDDVEKEKHVRLLREAFDLPEEVHVDTGRGKLPNADLAIAWLGKNPTRIVIDFSLYTGALAKGAREMVSPEGFWIGNLPADAMSIPIWKQCERQLQVSPFAATHTLGVTKAKVEDHLLLFYDLFSGKEKSFYKTCQSASYLSHWCDIDTPRPGTRLIAGAYTVFGLEMLGARWENGKMTDPLASLRDFYPKLYQKNRTENKAQAIVERESATSIVLDRTRKVLRFPKKRFSGQVERILSAEYFGTEDFQARETFWARPCDDLAGESEQIHTQNAFCNPASGLDHPLIQEALKDYVWWNPERRQESFRDLHADALQYGFATMHQPSPGAEKENLSITFALAHPGAGKTTTIVRTVLESPAPCVFLYASPRVSINDNVIAQIQKHLIESEEPVESAIAVTTNHEINALASHFSCSDGGVPSGLLAYHNWDSPVTSFRGIAYEPMEAIEALRSDVQKMEGASIRVEDKDERRRSVRKHRTNAPSVLKTLFDGIEGLLAPGRLSESVRIFLASVSLQAFRGDRWEQSARGFLDTIGPQLLRRVGDSGLRPRIVLFVDEVTGSGEGLRIVRSMIQLARDTAAKYPGVDVHVIVADASLIHVDVLRQWLESDSGDFPACVLQDAGSTNLPVFRRLDWQDGPTRYGPATVVEASAYPAGRLDVNYRIRVGEPDRRENAGSGQQDRSLRISFLIDTITEVFRGCPDGQQVLVFVQDKKLLEDMENSLKENLKLSSQQIRTLSADVPPKMRREILEDQGKNIRILLMTSAGSRGLDFPKVTRYVINVDHFSPETTLLEVQQVLFRGRGHGCDGLDRQVYFTMSGVFDKYDLSHEPVWGEGGTQELQMQLHLKSFLMDRLLMMVMLRSTLLTRACGRSRMERYSDSGNLTDTLFCPLGETGSTNPAVQLADILIRGKKAMENLRNRNLIEHGSHTNFMRYFAEVFHQRSVSVRLNHSRNEQAVWARHPVLAFLDDRISTVFIEQSGRDTSSLAEREFWRKKFTDLSPLVCTSDTRIVLGDCPGGAVWVRGFLLILEIKEAHLLLRQDMRTSESKKRLHNLLVAILKKIREVSGKKERIRDSYRAIHDLDRLLEEDGNAPRLEKEILGEEPGEILLVTPFTPPWVQVATDPESNDAFPGDFPWPSYLTGASNLLDRRSDNRWPMLTVEDVAERYNLVPDSQGAEPYEYAPFALVFSANTGKPLRILKRVQTTRGFQLLTTALPS